jgi:hypothetical protein
VCEVKRKRFRSRNIKQTKLARLSPWPGEVLFLRQLTYGSYGQ